MNTVHVRPVFLSLQCHHQHSLSFYWEPQWQHNSTQFMQIRAASVWKQASTLAINPAGQLDWPLTYIKYSADFLRPITTAEAFEAVDWLADLPQRTWPQAAGRSSDVILLKSTASISAAAMFVGDHMTASTLLAGVAAERLTDWFR